VEHEVGGQDANLTIGCREGKIAVSLDTFLPEGNEQFAFQVVLLMSCQCWAAGA